jgi:microcin C transport system substrate-binding protein
VGRGESRLGEERAVRDGAGDLTRRGTLKLAGAGAALAALRPFAWAEGKSGLHGLSIFGDLKYGPDFQHFDYVNPAAPKGGRMNFGVPNWYYNQNPQTFNTLNSFVLRGDAPPRMEFVFDSLMVRAEDEPDSVYGLIAESASVSEDGNVFTFTLRQGPRFHDGSELTAEDVAFSLMTLKEKGHPQISEVITPMAKAEAIDTRTVAVTLDGSQNRATILTIVGLPVFSKAYYSDRSFEASTLDPPLGSGAYKAGRLGAGRFIEYERVADYWGEDLPVNVGRNNFDVIRIDFFQERQAAFEAFKKGEITYREEFTSLTWAKDYNFPSFIAGKVKKALFPEEKLAALQGSFFNTRRSKFADPRTRLAIALAFDFEWSNRNLFFDSYEREFSFFQKSTFMAEGMPSAAELALMEPYRSDLPPEAFDEAYVPPKTDGSGSDRRILKQAADLLAAAGWEQKGGRLVNAGGETLELEFLIHASVFERVLAPYSQNLRRIGIQATIRQVDPAQYQSRINDFDFDVMLMAIGFTGTPLDGLDEMYGSRAADIPGTRNYAGIKSKAVDALIGRLDSVETREELTTILKTLDRVLRAGQYWVPSWFRPDHLVAHWDMFGWPETKPDYGFSIETTWWFDSERAAAIGKA